MKKTTKQNVGTITFQTSYNYGAVLQAYALRKTIEKLGYSSDIINYIPPIRSQAFYEKPSLFSKGISPSSLAVFGIDRILFPAPRKKRYERFMEFFSSQLKLAAETCRTTDDLRNIASKYDTFVCGSDQVWNTRSYGINDGYFLNFVPPDKRKVAYAPSFGHANIEDSHREFVKKSLASFHSLSTREETGKKIIAEIVGRESEVVLDPTFLIKQDDWNEIAAERVVDEPYILCYIFSYPKTLLETARTLKKRTGFPILFVDAVGRGIFCRSMKAMLDVGPREFLALIRDAEIVLTTSFHGTALSINYRKPFITQYKGTNSVAAGSRITGILDKVQLASRICSDKEPPPVDPFVIDYTIPLTLLDEEYKHSWDYLSESLQ